MSEFRAPGAFDVKVDPILNLPKWVVFMGTPPRMGPFQGLAVKGTPNGGTQDDGNESPSWQTMTVMKGV